MPAARKVMPRDIEDIRAARAAGVPMKEIASRYGLSVDWTRRIALGEVFAEPRRMVVEVPRWRYIPEHGRALLLGLAQAELARCYMDPDRTRPREVMGLIQALRVEGARLAVETVEVRPVDQCGALGETSASSGSSSVTPEATG